MTRTADIAEERLIWLMGSSRSGSSWLLNMLTGLERVVGVDDPHLGHHLGVWRPIPLAFATAENLPSLTTLTDVKREQPDYFLSDAYREAWEPALRELVLARFGAQARDLAEERGVSRPFVAIKDPGASTVAELIRELFPHSRLVFLLRDGRDVVDSWLDAYREGSWGLEEGTYALHPGGREAFIRWQASVWLYRTEAVQRAFARHHFSRRVLVRYEDLRDRPRRTLARLCLKLGIATTPGRLNRIVEANRFDRVPSAERGAGHRVRRAEPGAWRRSLTEREQAALHEVIGPKLAELGYLPRERAPRLRKTA